MHQSFRISFLYLLLVIPQHGNSPLPDLESWLQKDQDDGFDQHDLTSSLTGRDESFGSAHQTYQKSLIRGKKSPDSELTPRPRGNSEFNANNRFKRHEPFLFSRNLKEESSEVAEGKDREEARFEGFDSDPRSSPGLNYLGPPNQGFQNSENINPPFKNKYIRENQYIDIIPSQDLLRSSRMKTLYKKQADALDRDLNPRMFFHKRLKQGYGSNPFFYYPQSMSDDNLNYPSQEDYLNVDDERRSREMSDEYKNSAGPEGKSPQILDENEYYDADVSLGEEDDYNQLLSNRRYLRKRDETSQVLPSNAKLGWNAFDYKDQGERFMNYRPARKVRREKANPSFSAIKTRDTLNTPGTNYIWTLNDDTHSQELADLMKNSQRALQEVQLFQSKLPYKTPETNNLGVYNQNPYAKCEAHNYAFDGTRLKREDEDEQKNMKTGTDEGGGEYEDEEGKGHKDEEEYYEDADLSGSETKSEPLAPDEQNEKYVKREILKDSNLKSAKNEAHDQSEDYELNLQNAPVEHGDLKSKKSTYREGEKTNKNTVRKGVKIWDQWGKWSPCSVTCGVGRSTRWRHCIGGGCAQGEKEAQIKRCTNPAC